MTFKYERSYTGEVQAVIFDWAGTVVDYGSCAPAEVFIEVFRKKGIDISMNEARFPMGVEKKLHIQSILMMEEVAKKWQKRFGRSWNQDDLNELYLSYIPAQMFSLKSSAALIPGVLETTRELRNRGLKIGSTTGYNSDMISVLAEEAKVQGFIPDAVVCSSDVIAGRPYPWMALECAQRLQVCPMEAIVKVGDTVADIEEGLNAGMWTIGIAKTGNEVGLRESELQRLDPPLLKERLSKAHQRLLHAGAHEVVDSVEQILPVIDRFNQKLKSGKKP